MNEEIKNILNNINFNDNKLIKVNNNLYLTNNQIEVLKRYNIDYETSNSLRDLMLKIENIIDYEDIEDLELLLDKLSERQYYEETKICKKMKIYAKSLH